MSDDYEVSHIVDEDYNNPKQRLFKIRWQGYSEDFDTWEPLENLVPGAIEVVREWDRQKKQAQKQKTNEGKAALVVQKKQETRKRSVSQISDDDKKASSGRVNSSPKVVIDVFRVC